MTWFLLLLLLFVDEKTTTDAVDINQMMIGGGVSPFLKVKDPKKDLRFDFFGKS